MDTPVALERYAASFLCLQPEENINTTERVFQDRQYQVSAYSTISVFHISRKCSCRFCLLYQVVVT